MALNFQSSTLSLTLPISCQICLGKVKQPVICANHHVFCSSCMEMWLKKASQCPTCRVPITPENPCREIIGGTNESDHSESPSMRKCLRKTRGELLLREYEEEIAGLIRENEELKIKTKSLESQLKTALDPCSINTEQTEDTKVDPHILEELTNKLRAATDVCDKVQQSMDKLREANKTLRSQNVDLVQENMRLKAEVASRSPQKFGRYTVAALEAKIQLHERDVDHLKRALERSDQYIEDLESRLGGTESSSLEVQETCTSSRTVPEVLTQQQKMNMMMRSLSDGERGLICSNPEAEYQTFSTNNNFICIPSADQKDFNQNLTEDWPSNASEFLPTTPSSAFRSLTLRSPGIREKKVAFKPASYLRRLDFDELASPVGSMTENQFSSLDKFPKDSSPNDDAEPSKSVLWGGWQGCMSNDADPSKSSVDRAASASPVSDCMPDGHQMSSEASMDAAYLDKISELDSMMLDGESSSSRGSQLALASSLPTHAVNILVSEKTCPDVLSSQSPCDDMDDPLNEKEDPKDSTEETSDAQESGNESRVAYQTDKLSLNLLFDLLEKNKAGLSASVNGVSQDDHVSLSSTSIDIGQPTSATKDRHSLNMNQPTKRRSYSPFSTNSPTKLSKLM